MKEKPLTLKEIELTIQRFIIDNRETLEQYAEAHLKRLINAVWKFKKPYSEQ